jgi:hypothetical protein
MFDTVVNVLLVIKITWREKFVFILSFFVRLCRKIFSVSYICSPLLLKYVSKIYAFLQLQQM